MTASDPNMGMGTLDEVLEDNPDIPDLVCGAILRDFEVDLVAILKGESREGTSFEIERFAPLNKSPEITRVSWQEIGNLVDGLWPKPKEDKERGCSIDHVKNQAKVDELNGLLGTSGILQFFFVHFKWTGSEDAPRLVLCGTKKEVSEKEGGRYFRSAMGLDISQYAELLSSPQGFHLLEKVETLKKMKEFGSRRGQRMIASQIMDLALFNKLANASQGDRSYDDRLIDLVWSTYLDSDVAMRIVPPFRGPSYSVTDEHSNKVVLAPSEYGAAAFEWTHLSAIRKQIWEKIEEHTELEQEQEWVEQIVKSLGQQELDGDSSRRETLPPLRVYLPSGIPEQFSWFAGKYGLELERLRTCFFYLHHTANNGYVGTGTAMTGCVASGSLFQEKFLAILLKRTAVVLGRFLFRWYLNGKLKITSDWLAGWFLLQVLRYLATDVSRLGPNYSRNGFLEFCYYLSCYCLYVIHWMKNAGEIQGSIFGDVRRGHALVLESQIYLLAEYSHIALNLERNVPLFDLLKNVWNAEAILLTARDSYRDHLHHVLNTCFLGLLLIDCSILTRIGGGTVPPGLTGSRVTRNWVIAALLHDIGHGLRPIKDILGQLKFLRVAPPLGDYLDKVHDSLNKHENDLVEAIGKVVGVPTVRRLKHGVLSAAVASAVSKTGPTENSELHRAWIDDIQPAIWAIIHHDEPEMDIDPREHPLSVLLITCDNLQEWDRPRVAESFRYELPVYARGNLTVPPPSTSTLVDYLTVNLVHETLRKDTGTVLRSRSKEEFGRCAIPSGPLEFEIVFKDATGEEFEPALVWVQDTFAFQKVKALDLDLEIRITLYHKLSKDITKLSSRQALTELELFQDFVRENRSDHDLQTAFSNWIAFLRIPHPVGEERDPVWIFYEGPDEPEGSEKDKAEKFTVKIGGKRGLQPSSFVPFVPNGVYKKFHEWKKHRFQELLAVRATPHPR